MSITYSTTEGAAAVLDLTPGSTLIAAFEDGSGQARDWLPINAVAGGTAASAIFPSLTSVSAVTVQNDSGIQGVLEDESGLNYGAITLVLRAAPGDTVSAPGMAFTLDSNLSVVTATGTFT